MKARHLCPSGDGSPSSRCWCIDMTAAWFHGAAKKPLVVSVNWNGRVSLSFLPPLQLSIASVICSNLFECVCFMCICVCVCARKCCSWTHKHQEVLMYLCSVFSNHLREKEWAGAKVKKGEQICQSLFAMLVWNESTLCYLKHTQISDVSPCQGMREKKNNNSQMEFYSLSLWFSSSLLNWNCCFEEIKEDFCLTWTFRN